MSAPQYVAPPLVPSYDNQFCQFSTVKQKPSIASWPYIKWKFTLEYMHCMGFVKDCFLGPRPIKFVNKMLLKVMRLIT